MAKLNSSLVCCFGILVISVNYSAGYFGLPQKAKQAETVGLAIKDVVGRINKYNAYYDIANTIDKDSSPAGSYIYLKILTLLQSHLSTIGGFLDSLNESAQSEHLSAAIIISKTENLITQLIEMASLKKRINDAIVAGGSKWFLGLPKIDSIFDGIANDLKTIFGALIVICDNDRNAEEQDLADQKLLLKLQDMLQQINKLHLFYDKIKAIDEFIQMKITAFNDARTSFKNIFDESLKDYNEQLKAAENGIISRNLLHSKAFMTGLLEKSGDLSVEIDETDGNLVIQGSKYDIRSKYLTPIQKMPTNLKEMIDKLLLDISNSIDSVPNDMLATKKLLIRLLYNTAKNQDIDETYNCIITDLLSSRYDQLISDHLTGLRTITSFAYLFVTPFSSKIRNDFYFLIKEIAKEVQKQTTKSGAASALKTIAGDVIEQVPDYTSEKEYINEITSYVNAPVEQELVSFIIKNTEQKCSAQPNQYRN